MSCEFGHKKEGTKLKLRLRMMDYQLVLLYFSGERLIGYVAVSDIVFGIVHTSQHAYLLAYQRISRDLPCKVLGFLILVLYTPQVIVFNFTALNALTMVGFGKRIRLGRYDWKMLTVAFGSPVIMGIIFLELNAFGPADYW